LHVKAPWQYRTRLTKLKQASSKNAWLQLKIVDLKAIEGLVLEIEKAF